MSKHLNTQWEEIRKIRTRLKYSISEMAKVLGLIKTTYANYESGKRKIPEDLISTMLEVERKDIAFMKRYEPCGEFDKLLAQEYPFGIVSDVDFE